MANKSRQTKPKAQRGQPEIKGKGYKRIKIQSKEVYESTRKEVDTLMKKGRQIFPVPSRHGFAAWLKRRKGMKILMSRCLFHLPCPI